MSPALFRPSTLRARAQGLLACVTLLGGLVLASADAQAGPVRLTALYELAMLQHPSILQARADAQAALYNLEAAQWGRFPTLSFNLRTDSIYAQSVGQIEQPIWAGGRIEGRIDYERSNVSAAEASLRDAELNALTQVTSAFFELLRLTMRLRTADENVKEHENLLGLITRRAEAQISPQADVTLAQARLQQAVTERLQIVRQLDSTRSSLVQWAGPLDGDLLPPMRIDYVRVASERELIERAFSASAQRAKLKAQLRSAEAQIKVAEAQIWPTVVAGIQHIVSGTLVPGMDRNHAYLGLQYQPGAGLSARAGVRAAEAKRDAALREIEGQERLLAAQAKSLASDIDALQAQVQPADALASDTDEVVASYLRQYQIGRKNWLDVLNAVREKNQAIYNLADVRYTLLQSQVKLMLLTGDVRGDRTLALHE